MMRAVSAKLIFFLTTEKGAISFRNEGSRRGSTVVYVNTVDRADRNNAWSLRACSFFLTSTAEDFHNKSKMATVPLDIFLVYIVQNGEIRTLLR